ncbi:MAG TPA: hypothetical protein VGC65_00110 [Bacteroidia bacterium]|jgi:hypothetical protein
MKHIENTNFLALLSRSGVVMLFQVQLFAQNILKGLAERVYSFRFFYV